MVNRSLLELGVVEGGELAEQHQLDEGLLLAREMLDQWALDGLLVPGHTLTEHTIGATPRFKLSIGPTNADITLENVPVSIQNIRYNSQQSNFFSYSLRAVSADFWLEEESNSDDYPPRAYWYSPELPNGIIRFDASLRAGDKITIATDNYLVNSALSLDSVATFLPGYQSAIRLNLALEMASSNGIRGANLSPITVLKAQETKRNIRKSNLQHSGQTKFDLASQSNAQRYRRGYQDRNFDNF